MVCLDLDHPDIETFINWKVREEIKVAAMVEGSSVAARASSEIAAAALGSSSITTSTARPTRPSSGQNSQQLRPHPRRVLRGGRRRTATGDLTCRTDRQGRARRSRPASCGTRSATPPGAAPIPACSTTPRSTSGTPARAAGRINASNPCSEYMFLDNTACNLASLNLLKFFDAETRHVRRRGATTTRSTCGRSCSRSAC